MIGTIVVQSGVEKIKLRSVILLSMIIIYLILETFFFVVKILKKLILL